MVDLRKLCAQRVAIFWTTPSCDCSDVFTVQTSQPAQTVPFIVTNRLEEQKPERSCDSRVPGCYSCIRFSQLPISSIASEKPGTRVNSRASRDCNCTRCENRSNRRVSATRTKSACWSITGEFSHDDRNHIFALRSLTETAGTSKL